MLSAGKNAPPPSKSIGSKSDDILIKEEMEKIEREREIEKLREKVPFT